MPEPPRSVAHRIRDTLRRLESDIDAWVATADADGGPWLVPLSFVWDGERLLLSTTGSSPTGRNLAAGGGAIRIGIGETRDVVLVEGTVDGTVDGVTGIAPADLPASIGDRFAVTTGFDPRTLGPAWRYYWVRPVRVLAWREANELSGRVLMRDGRWLAG